MIKTLKLKNYRCFSNHSIEFKKNNTIVGENNAGKSTIIEALRVISIVARRYKHIGYSQVPDWSDLPRRYRGIKPSLKEYNFNFQSVFYRYSDPPAQISVEFYNGTEIVVYIGPDENIYAVIYDEKGNLVKDKRHAETVFIPQIFILPQITSLRSDERRLGEEYIQRSLFSSLSSLHFRNQLVLYPTEFETFKNLVEQTWEGCEIKSLDVGDELVNPLISLFVRDNDFTAEVGWMGHGLQMWLQIMWFLSFTTSEDIVILDEPDVYMHADLQRKIIKLLLNKGFFQTIVATHSLEIIAEAQPENILIIDKTSPSSKFANSVPSVQKLIDNIGCLHNIQLTRFWKCKKCLLVEGKDVDFLKYFHNTLFPYSEHPIETIPNMSIGGWSGLKYAIGTSLILKNSAGELVNTYCILDKDYYPNEIIQKTYKEAGQNDLILHVWNKKEIENYLLIPEAICRIIEKRSNTEIDEGISKIQEQINIICDSVYNETFDKISNEFVKNKIVPPEKANPKAREFIDSHWDSLENKLKLVSGKKVISELSKWSQDTFSVSFSAGAIVREIKKEEIDFEMKCVIETIENNSHFDFV